MPLISEETDRQAVDWHAHVFMKSLPMQKNRRYAPAYDAPLENYVALLKKHNKSGGLLVQPSFLGRDNSFLISCLESIRKNPSPIWLRGVVVVPPSTPVRKLKDYDAAGVVGVRLNLLRQDIPDFSNVTWRRFFSRVNALNWHVEVQLEGWRWPQAFEQLADCCERLVVDHFGLPDVHNPFGCVGFRMICAYQGQNLWVKTSAPYRVYPSLDPEGAAMACRDSYQALRDSIGENALLWGSDWPWTQFEDGHSYSDTVKWLGYWHKQEAIEASRK
ncbi:amidohydrolase [Pelagibius sp. Alg239-R121]|uniref:amidohydrolase family protein n=1 Tax=Pelagibius sp. Alg239-R121 TaxID=2993448 RepID=UPI0024A66BB2|nr:amidohydrolase family protein [Pelagibius sp. Alg239-R121]